MAQPRSIPETIGASMLINLVFDTGAVDSAAIVAAEDIFEGRELNFVEEAAIGIEAAEGTCLLLGCFAMYLIAEQTKRENLASQYSSQCTVQFEPGTTPETEAYIKNHNKFIKTVTSLYSKEEIDINTLNRLCIEAAKMYNTFKTDPSAINDDFINTFNQNTYVPLLENNVLYKIFWKDLKEALIFSAQVAAATAVITGLFAIAVAPTMAVFLGSWTISLLTYSLQMGAAAGSAYFLLSMFTPRGNISTPRNELVASVEAARPSLSA